MTFRQQYKYITQRQTGISLYQDHQQHFKLVTEVSIIDSQHQTNLQNIIHILSKINHPNIAKLQNFFIQKKYHQQQLKLYVVMEMVKGGYLVQYQINQNHLSQMYYKLKQIILSLHSKYIFGIIPIQNMLMDQNFQLKVVLPFNQLKIYDPRKISKLQYSKLMMKDLNNLDNIFLTLKFQNTNNIAEITDILDIIQIQQTAHQNEEVQQISQKIDQIKLECQYSQSLKPIQNTKIIQNANDKSPKIIKTEQMVKVNTPQTFNTEFSIKKKNKKQKPIKNRSTLYNYGIWNSQEQIKSYKFFIKHKNLIIATQKRNSGFKTIYSNMSQALKSRSLKQCQNYCNREKKRFGSFFGVIENAKNQLNQQNK